MRVLAEIDASIAEQEERVRRGEAPLAIGQDLVEELFDMDALSKRLLTVNQPPALEGLLARACVDLLRLAARARARVWARRRKPRTVCETEPPAGSRIFVMENR